MAKRSAILVNGALGHLGKAVVAQIVDRPVLQGARRPDGIVNAVLIDSDGKVDRAKLADVAAIINCAGRVSGDDAIVWQANVEHPLKLATTAKAAGVRCFVQVSSFSIFGHAELIDATTKIDPVNYYGETKVAAEAGLNALQDDNFAVICVRLPFMFGVENPAMMGSLIKALSKLPLLPVSPQQARRSMMTYKDAAQELIRATVAEASDARCVADPLPFTFDMLAGKMRAVGMRPAIFISLPDWICKIIIRLMPGVGRRLFASSLLSPSFNAQDETASIRGVEAEIEAILRAV